MYRREAVEGGSRVVEGFLGALRGFRMGLVSVGSGMMVVLKNEDI